MLINFFFYICIDNKSKNKKKKRSKYEPIS